MFYISHVYRLGGGDQFVGDFFIPDLGLELPPYLLSESLAGVHHLVRVQWAPYLLRMNPVLCRRQIVIGNPYPEEPRDQPAPIGIL